MMIKIIISRHLVHRSETAWHSADDANLLLFLTTPQHLFSQCTVEVFVLYFGAKLFKVDFFAVYIWPFLHFVDKIKSVFYSVVCSLHYLQTFGTK